MHSFARSVAGGLSVLLLVLSAADVPAAEPPPELVYKTPQEVEFRVTAEGLSRISVGERPLATGGWYAWNAGPGWFGIGAQEVLGYAGYSDGVYAKAAAAVEDKSIELLGPDHARVRHQQPDVTVTYDYRFSGEDVTIAARMENNHATAAIEIPAFGGLRFTFARPPEGIMPVWHMSYLAHVKLEAFHPALINKIGGSCASDGEVGVGVTPLATGVDRSLVFWDYDDWNAGRRENVPRRWLSYLRPKPVEPGGALTFRIKLRVSPNTAWQHLLAPYKEHFLATYGPRRYRADDHRLVAVAHVNRNRESITAENPYGFHGGFRRLDLSEGVEELCDLLIPALKKANGQGVIFWGQGGEHPRGAMYRPDFDVLPPEVEANWKTLAARFRQAGLKLGVCTRPRHMAVQLDWNTDGTIDINPDDPQHLAILWGRYRRMIDRGATMFYLDSFGSSLEDVKTMRYLREKMGPDVQTYAEHACDAILPYSGLYTETDFWAKGSAEWCQEDQYRPRTGLRFQEIGRWLVGDVPCITRRYDVHGNVPEGFEQPERFFLRKRMTPMVADYLLPQQAEDLGKLQAEYLQDNGQWRN